ncbi:MAG: imelysin family protein [Myxococcota bacterium]|nr:imelysin family protein [Myxococcota bacterium]
MKRLPVGPYIVVAFCAGVMLHCGTDSRTTTTTQTQQQVTQRDVLRSLAQDFTTEHYVEFEVRCMRLVEQTTALCNELNVMNLAAAREAWLDAKPPGKHAELVHFGATVAYPDRLGPLIDDWPLNEVLVERLLDGEDSLTQDAFEKMGSGTRGLPTIEYLLWADGRGTLDALRATPRRCKLLTGAAVDLRANAQRLIEVWNRDWVPQLTQPGTVDGSDYTSEQIALDEWINRMGFTVENIRRIKLGTPLGDKSDDKPLADTLESRLSGRSLRDAVDALRGVQQVWTGPSDGRSPGIKALVVSESLVTQIDGLFQGSFRQLEEIPETLETAIINHRAAIQEAQESLRLLQATLQGRLAERLGATITFNDADGD